MKHFFTQEEKEDETKVKVFVGAVLQSLPATEARLTAIQEKQKADPVKAKLISYCQVEWPEKKTYTPTRRDHIGLKEKTSLWLQSCHLEVSMRPEILQDLHSGHQGIAKCRARACWSVWRPGRSVHIIHMVEYCNTCSQHRAEHREHYIPKPSRHYLQYLTKTLSQMTLIHSLLPSEIQIDTRRLMH